MILDIPTIRERGTGAVLKGKPEKAVTGYPNPGR
jgi:hypothetical protein